MDRLQILNEYIEVRGNSPVVTDRPLECIVNKILRFDVNTVGQNSHVIMFGAGTDFRSEKLLKDLTKCKLSLVDMSLAEERKNAWVSIEDPLYAMGRLLKIIECIEPPDGANYTSYSQLQSERLDLASRFADNIYAYQLPLGFKDLRQLELLHCATHILDSYGVGFYVKNSDYPLLCDNIAWMLKENGLYAAAPVTERKLAIWKQYISTYNNAQNDLDCLELTYFPYSNTTYTIHVTRKFIDNV